MSEPHVREWRLYLRDMIDFGEKVIGYTQGMNLEPSSAAICISTPPFAIWNSSAKPRRTSRWRSGMRIQRFHGG